MPYNKKVLFLLFVCSFGWVPHIAASKSSRAFLMGSGRGPIKTVALKNISIQSLHSPQRQRDSVPSHASKAVLVSATPIPYEGIISLNEINNSRHLLGQKPKALPNPKQFFHPASSRAEEEFDCSACKTKCPQERSKSINFSALQITQCIENAGNPAIRRALLTALRDKDMTTFSQLVTQYNLLNIPN